jgi:hypothetical protein
VLQKAVSDAGEPVAMGNHNLSDQSCDCGVQKREKALALEVDARSDICDDPVVRKLVAQEIDLPGKVTLLL